MTTRKPYSGLMFFLFIHLFVKIGMDEKNLGKRWSKDIFATAGFEIGFLVDVRVLCV